MSKIINDGDPLEPLDFNLVKTSNLTYDVPTVGIDSQFKFGSDEYMIANGFRKCTPEEVKKYHKICGKPPGVISILFWYMIHKIRLKLKGK